MKKFGYFMLCFVPLLLAVGLQFLLSFTGMGIAAFSIFGQTLSEGSKISLTDFFTSVIDICSNQTFNSLISIAFAMSGLIIFGFWYFKGFHTPVKQSPRKIFNLRIVISLVLFIPALQLLSSFLTSGVATVFPSWMEYYENLMKAAGLSSTPSPLLFLYAVILGPVEEELTFRGVTMGCAKKALPFWAANLFQALLFGVFHMNMIQGIYAFFIGLFFGYVCEKGGSIYLSIGLHMLFNLWGTTMTGFSIGNTPLSASLFLLFSIFLTILALQLFLNGVAARQNKAKEFPVSSDI